MTDKVHSQYALRGIRVEDYSFVYKLHCETLDGYVEKHAKYDEDEVKKQLFEERLYPDKLKIIVVDGRDVGFLAVTEVENGLIVDRIAITRGEQGKGIGTSVMQDILDRARARSVPVTLYVMKTDKDRHHFSELGFTPYGEDDHHYFLRAE